MGFGYAEGYVELIALDQPPLEVVLLDHEELLDGFVPDSELQGGADGLEVEELGAEVVLYESIGLVEVFPVFLYGFLNLEEGLIALIVPDLEADELYLVDVVLGLAQELVGGLGEGSYFLYGDGGLHGAAKLV